MLQDLINKDTPVNHPKIRNLLDNEEIFMEEIMTFTDKRLEKMISTINLQLPMALEQQKMVEVEVLYLFKQMLMYARVRKNEIECKTGIYEEDKTERKRKPKVEKETEMTSILKQKAQIIEEEFSAQEVTSSLKQLSLFNLNSG